MPPMQTPVGYKAKAGRSDASEMRGLPARAGASTELPSTSAPAVSGFQRV